MQSNTWLNNLSYRNCKRSIIETIGLCFMQLHYKLCDGKQLVLAGCFSSEGEEPIVITKDNFSSPATCLTSNAEESDVRI